MKTKQPMWLVIVVLAVTGIASADMIVADSSAPWLGFMNVFNLPGDGGGFQFGSPWGIPDLVATFDDGAGTLTLTPNTIGDPDPYWYIGGGGPGAPGNKIMEANLYIEETGGTLNGQTVTFSGTVLSDTFTAAHTTRIFVRDFAPDFSSSVDAFLEITAPGTFSVSLDTINDPARYVQYGFQTTGENVWITDTAPFGSIVIETIPEPASMLLLGLGGLLMRKRK